MPVFEDPSVDAEKAWQRRRILSWFVLITVAHLVLGRRTHGLHAIHILLASLYLFPIFWASLAFELRGGVIASLATAATYFAHIVWSWSGEPLANVDQYGMLGVYLFVGISSGLLVRSAERRRRRETRSSAEHDAARRFRDSTASFSRLAPETRRRSRTARGSARLLTN